LVEYPRIDVAGTQKTKLLSVRTVEEMNRTPDFSAELYDYEDLAKGSLVEVYRGSSPAVFLRCLLRTREFTEEDARVKIVISGPGQLALLDKRTMADTTWTEQTLDTIIGAILSGESIAKGTVDTFSLLHRWSQTSDTDFSGNTHTNVTVSGSGDDAKVILSDGVASGNEKSMAISPTGWQGWRSLYASATLNAGTSMTLDVLRASDDAVLKSGLAVNTTHDISDVTESGIKLRANLSASTPQAWLEQTAQNQELTLYYGSYTRRGQRITISGKNVWRVSLYMHKVGSPTGTGYLRIRKVSDDTVISGAEVSLDVSTLGSDWAWVDFNFSSPVYINADVRVLFEYSGGDVNNFVVVGGYGSNVVDGYQTGYSGSYYNDTGAEATFKLYERYTPELLDWQVYHYTDRLTYSATGRPSESQLISALAELTDAEFKLRGDAATLDFKAQVGTDYSAQKAIADYTQGVAVVSAVDSDEPKITKVYGYANTVGGTPLTDSYGGGNEEATLTDKLVTDSDALRTALEKLVSKLENGVSQVILNVVEDGWGFDLGDAYTLSFPDVGVEEGGSPTVVYEDDEGFWSAENWGAGSVELTLGEETSTVKRGSSSLRMEAGAGAYAYWRIRHDYGSAQDWSGADYVGLWLYGAGSGETFHLDIHTTLDVAYYRWSIVDDWVGWRRVVLPLGSADQTVGSPSLSSVSSLTLGIDGADRTGTWWLDRVVVDSNPYRVKRVERRMSQEGLSTVTVTFANVLIDTIIGLVPKVADQELWLRNV